MKSHVRRWPEKVLLGALVGVVIAACGGCCCGLGYPRPWRAWWPPCDPTQCEEGYGDSGCETTANCPTGPTDMACQGCLPGPALPPPSYYPGPLSWLFARLTWPYAPGFAGCGERYWSPWVSDPPDCCDPCDGYGQWTGAPRSTGYSSMYPNQFSGAAYPSAVPMEGATGPVPGNVQTYRPPCPECSRSPQTRTGWVPPSVGNPRPNRPDQGVYPTGYSNLAQRPRQPYRDPVAQ